MASRATAEKWLRQLANLRTAPGHEGAVVDWVAGWADRRDDLRFSRDKAGNALITQKSRRSVSPVVAVAHMDHPGFVVTAVAGREVAFEFRGGVNPEYFDSAKIELGHDRHKATISSYDPGSGHGLARLDRRSAVEPGDIGLWSFRSRRVEAGRFAAPACDDLAGVAASLAALDRARGRPDQSHLSVLLTRGEEIGFLGAFAAAREGTLAKGSRILSIETSPELPDARIGDGPIIRVGDRLTIYDREMTNRISSAARDKGLKHQRKLMSGGACEATAFGISGFSSTGLCVALGNHHNRGDLDAVTKGTGAAIARLEEISLDDYHGLIDLILLATGAVDQVDPMVEALGAHYAANRHRLD